MFATKFLKMEASMKRMARICCTLALLVMALGAVPTANAALKTFGGTAVINNPNPAAAPVGCPTAHVAGLQPIGGIPLWFMDQNGVSVQACVDPLATCGLIGLGDAMFNEACPISYPDNFPTEAFYSDVGAIFAVGSAEARVVLAMEYTFVDAISGALISANPRPANAVGVPFQRQRLLMTYPAGVVAPTVGNFTITHPWGATTFTFGQANCKPNAGGLKCTMTLDMPAAALPANPTAALGINVVGPPRIDSMSTFVRDPAAPTGFLGSGAAAASFVGAAPGSLNSITVVDALGNSGTTAALTLLVGKTIGMEVTPGSNLDLGGINIITANAAGAVLVPQTVTVTNTTGNPVLFGALTPAGVDAADFVVAPPTQPVGGPALPDCAGATVPLVDPLVAGSGKCGFDVTFKPAAAPKAARAATVALAPTTVQPAVPVVPPLPNPPPITMNLKGAAQVDVSVTAGAAVPAGASVTVTPATQAVGAGTAATFTVKAANKQFKVKDVAEGATLIAPAAADPTSFTIANVGAVNHAITADIMPSGDLDASGALDIADAQKALQIVAGVQAAAGTDKPAMIVAPLVSGVPAPVAGRAEPNIGDVLVILRRVINLDTW
jgi:hypothetical protein